MKIAFLSCFPPFRGGISQFNTAAANSLRSYHGIELCALNFTRQYPEFLFPGKSQKKDSSDNGSLDIVSEAILDSANPFQWHRAAKKILDWGPDVVVTSYWMSYFSPCLSSVMRKLRRGGVRVVGVIHNAVPHEPKFFDKPLTKWFLRSLDGAVSLSHAVDLDVQRLYPGLKHIELFHPVYEHFGHRITRAEAFRALGLEQPRGKVLLFFGLIREYKGLDILLEAFKTLGEDYTLLVAGEPYGSFDKYQAIIDSMPAQMSSRIHIWPSFISDEKARNYFCASDLAVLPYRSATQSGIGAICLHFGVPMVSTDVGGLRESVLDRGLGLLASAPEPEEVAATIQKFFSDPSIAQKCHLCLEKERENLSWKSFSGAFLAFVNEL